MKKNISTLIVILVILFAILAGIGGLSAILIGADNLFNMTKKDHWGPVTKQYLWNDGLSLLRLAISSGIVAR